jgi:short-subunit dehydrogenase
MSDFKTKYGKWAVITGGSSGIGLAFAHLLAEKKMNVLPRIMH